MNLHSLKPSEGSTKNRKRIGRGQGSGKGGTSTKGHNGAQSRSGYKTKYNSEGGQMPLQIRVPKFGFKNPNRKVYRVVNLNTLQNLVEKGVSVINKDAFVNNGLANKHSLVKILGNGELKTKIEITADSFSKTAQKAIEALGGKITNLSKKK
ncbi:MAG: 50S ribosomal protein L15 [Bacteroidetes bacterium]|nr:50S ribosomal protein L15 [Bacteroidota bacterium]